MVLHLLVLVICESVPERKCLPFQTFIYEKFWNLNILLYSFSSAQHLQQKDVWAHVRLSDCMIGCVQSSQQGVQKTWHFISLNSDEHGMEHPTTDNETLISLPN